MTLNVIPVENAQEDTVAAKVAAYEAELRRQNDPAVLAQQARRKEWSQLRHKISFLTGTPPLCFRDGRNLMERFEAAEVADDLDVARELVGIAHNQANPHDYRPIAENEGMRARRLAAEEETRLRQAEVEKRNAELARQAQLNKFPDASFVLRDVEKYGTLRLNPDGAVTYTGAALGNELLEALVLHERHLRITLEQRWYDRIVLPAPSPSGPAVAAAA